MQLPEELLWTILGSLDVASLCTARLACRLFRQSASGHLKALHIKDEALENGLGSNFSQFAGLTRLEVSVSGRLGARYMGLLQHHRIGPFITHVSVFHYPHRGPEDLAHLMRLPKLRSLRLQADMNDVQLLPLGLQELHLEIGNQEDVSPLTRFSGLTELEMTVSESAPGLGSLTALRALRCLRLYWEEWEVSSSHGGPLTSLSLVLEREATREATLFSGLACLTGLSHLDVADTGRDVTRENLACLSHLTKLTCLGLVGSHTADCVGGSSVLLPLTRLVSVGLSYTGRRCRPPSLNVEALQSLTLLEVKPGVSVLQRATGLTHLEFSCRFLGAREYPHELGRMLAGMSRLCSLDLGLTGKLSRDRRPTVSLISQASTTLTRLRCSGEFAAADPDIEACRGLPCLCSLVLCNTPKVTAASLPALQAMTGLTQLILEVTGIRQPPLTPEIRAAFDDERLRRGWPRLDFRLF